MLNQEQYNKLKGAGYNDLQIRVYETTRPSAQAQGKSGFGQRTKQAFQTGVTRVKEGFQEAGEGRKNPISTGMKIGAGVIEAGFSPVTAAAEPVIRPTLGRAVNYAADKISDSPAVQKFADSKAGEFTSRRAEDVANFATIAGTVGGSKYLTGQTTKAAQTVGRQTQAFTAGTEKLVQQGVSKTKEALKPPTPSPQQAMGQVLQGETGDVMAGFKAMQGLDKVKLKNLTASTTFKELADKSDNFIKQLAGKVDDTLDNTTPVNLKDLQWIGKTKAGQPVKVDFVTRAMGNLKELYKKIGDDVEVKNMDDWIKQANTVGLTRRQVNNLSRKYGIEFSDKAFNKMGDPLTSVNAQGFELTRKGLKQTARGGMGGKQAQALDETVSNLYTFKKLVSKNAEAVQKLSQKIQERGLLEKIGHHATKVLDVLSGGSLRGMIGGLLPRGAGYKVMNALDLQEVLQKNLKVIENALEKGDDASLIEVMKKIK